MNLTISSALSTEKILRTRLNQLNELKNEVSRRTRFADPNQTVEPTYEVKDVDKKIVDINRALLKIDMKVKEVNAKTSLDVDVNLDELLSEIK